MCKIQFLKCWLKFTDGQIQKHGKILKYQTRRYKINKMQQNINKTVVRQVDFTHQCFVLSALCRLGVLSVDVWWRFHDTLCNWSVARFGILSAGVLSRFPYKLVNGSVTSMTCRVGVFSCRSFSCQSFVINPSKRSRLHAITIFRIKSVEFYSKFYSIDLRKLFSKLQMHKPQTKTFYPLLSRCSLWLNVTHNCKET